MQLLMCTSKLVACPEIAGWLEVRVKKAMMNLWISAIRSEHLAYLYSFRFWAMVSINSSSFS